jgi:hypothetical protein
MTDETAPDQGRRDRGFRDRKREDHALLLIDELRSSLGDLSRVKRILLELGRFYDPVLDGAIADVDLQKRIVEALDRGDRPRALAIIEERYDRYMKDRIHLGRGEGGG